MTDGIEARWDGMILPEPGEVLTDDALERVFEVVTDEIIGLGYLNVTVGASLADRTFLISAPLEHRGDYLALDSAIRSGFHAAGVITGGWLNPELHLRTRITVQLVDELV